MRGADQQLVTDRRAIAARIGTAAQHAVPPVDGNAMRMAGHFVPGVPSVDDVAALCERINRIYREPPFDMQRVARLAEREAAGQESRHLDRFLDVETEIDHGGIKLELNLRLAIRAHATEHAPELAVAFGHRCDQRMQRDLAGLE